MRLILLIGFVMLCVLAHGQSKYARIKIYGDAQSVGKLDIALDHVRTKAGEYVIGVFSEYESALIRNSGLRYEILTDDVTADYLKNVQQKPFTRSGREGCEATAVTPPLDTITVPHDFTLGTMGGFLKYEEMLAHLDNMAAKYPNLITVKKPIADPQSGNNFNTHQGRPIYYVKLSDNVEDDESASETQILYTALHHAREPGSLSQLIFYMYYLLENYGKNDWVTHLVDNREMIFVPCVNPDGYIHNQTTNPNGGGMWRKNRRPNGGGSFGVDLNRNYSYQWGVSGTSSDPNSDVYKGPSPFSEPETQAIRSLTQQYNFKMAFNYHSHGDLLLFPYGYANVPTPDHNRYTRLTEEMVVQNNYVNEQSVLLYPAAGDSDDYMYGNTTDKPRILAMTPEVGDDFWIPQSGIIPLCKETLWQNISMALQADVYPLVKILTTSVDEVSGNLAFTVEARGLTGLQDAQLTFVSMNGALTLDATTAVGSISPFSTKTVNVPYSVTEGTANGTPLHFVCTVTFNNGKSLNYPFRVMWKGVEAITGQVIFEDDFTTLDQWTTSGTWGLTSGSFVSGPAAVTDSPEGNYNNYVNMKIDTRNTIDLAGLQTAYLTFNARWNIELNDDYLQVSVVKNGVEYPVCGNYSRVNASGRIVYDGNQNSWITEQINLADFLGSEIKLRFRLKSDASATADGFYLDDIRVLGVAREDDEAPVLASIVPANNAVVSIDQAITLQFSENITVSQTNQIVLKSLPDHAVVESEIEVMGKAISIIPVALMYSTQYYLAISSTAVADLTGNYFYGMDNTHWKFSTSDAPDYEPPQVISLFPEPGTSDVAGNVVILARFNEPVLLEEGQVDLVDEQEQQIPADVQLTDQLVVTVTPLQNLLPGKIYTVRLNGIEDIAGNAFEGLAANWTFSTEIITGVEVSKASFYRIFPNPLYGQARISLPNARIVQSIHLVDIAGRVSEVLWKRTDDNQIEVEINKPPGMYIVQIKDARGQHAVKLLVK